ncbi:MAG: hypothetical protein U1E05_24150 [Patescibacteria group bacterium]|nr:hypothetical protein [Patescibacteria group bacterium]
MRRVVDAASPPEWADQNGAMVARDSLGGMAGIYVVAFHASIPGVASTCGFRSMQLDGNAGE